MTKPKRKRPGKNTRRKKAKSILLYVKRDEYETKRESV